MERANQCSDVCAVRGAQKERWGERVRYQSISLTPLLAELHIRQCAELHIRQCLELPAPGGAHGSQASCVYTYINVYI